MNWLKRNCESHEFLLKPRIPWKIFFPPSYMDDLAPLKSVYLPIWENQPKYTLSLYQEGSWILCYLPDNSSKPSRIQVQVSWKKTIPGWVKLNTDGSIIGILRRLVKVGCCAVVMGTGSLVLRGILGVFPAIWLSFGPLGWPLSGSTIERRQYQYDAKVIGFFLLSNLSTINLMLEPLLIVCRNLIRPFPNCTVTHIKWSK